MKFPTNYDEIISKIEKIEPIEYCKSRNYIDGKVTYLSPYISRGIISTKQVFDITLKRGFKAYHIEKFIQELSWRDHWQQNWIEKGEEINKDIRHKQKPINNYEIAKIIVDANTGIESIDQAIKKLYETGYMHNHLRMYIASICCNMAYNHWKMPAKWLYYNLLDADWASNCLSWQWVAGSNANKKYVANQDNINKYCRTKQKGTFLDVPYNSLIDFETPDILKKTISIDLKTNLPKKEKINLDNKLPTYIYNFYNLDPEWGKEIKANRILLLEPSKFNEYPISDNSLNFIIKLSNNISNIKIYVGEFSDLINEYKLLNINYKEHPLNNNYQGKEHPRDWIFNVKGYYKSFFSFWKKCRKELYS